MHRGPASGLLLWLIPLIHSNPPLLIAVRCWQIFKQREWCERLPELLQTPRLPSEQEPGQARGHTSLLNGNRSQPLLEKLQRGPRHPARVLVPHPRKRAQPQRLGRARRLVRARRCLVRDPDASDRAAGVELAVKDQEGTGGDAGEADGGIVRGKEPFCLRMIDWVSVDQGVGVEGWRGVEGWIVAVNRSALPICGVRLATQKCSLPPTPPHTTTHPKQRSSPPPQPKINTHPASASSTPPPPPPYPPHPFRSPPPPPGPAAECWPAAPATCRCRAPSPSAGRRWRGRRLRCGRRRWL